MIVQSTQTKKAGCLVEKDRCNCGHLKGQHASFADQCDNCKCKQFDPTVQDGTVGKDRGSSGLKDSGQRLHFDSGMVRDVADDKPAFDLVIPEGIPYSELMLTRWAELLRKGAIKYSRRNWEKANSDEELDRAKASAFRHFMQWFSGETDEDHAAAVFFNINEVETIKWKQANQKKEV